MGDPRKIRKKYSGPGHPWQKTRLDEERDLTKDYALSNKKELWKMVSQLKKFTNQAKKLIASITQQGEREKEQLIKRLSRLGLINPESKVEDVLNLKTRDLLERRLQTIVYRKGLARTMKQARQFIVHEHIRVKGNKITSPSKLVRNEEENTIEFCEKSTLSNAEHPERTPIARKEEPKEETDKQNKDKKRKLTRTRKPQQKKKETKGAKK